MYAQKRRTRPPKYFRYAPPMNARDTATDYRPKPPYPRAPPQCCSVYYYWWAFLRENEGYIACCKRGGRGPFAKLYADFGDVRDARFLAWWRRPGRYLFCEPEIGKPLRHRLPPESIDQKNEILVTIPINGDLERTIAELRGLLKTSMYRRKQQMKDRGKKELHSNARYPVYTMPVLTSLHQTLRIWQAKKALPNGTLAEIATEAGLALAKDYGKRLGSRVVLQSLTVWRCLKAAPALIYNVGEGRFPDVTPSPMMIEEAAAKKKKGKSNPSKRKKTSATPKTSKRSPEKRSTRISSAFNNRM